MTDKPSMPEQAIASLLENITDLDLADQENLETVLEHIDDLEAYAEEREAELMAQLGSARLETEKARAEVAQREETIKSLLQEFQHVTNQVMGIRLILR